MDNLPENKLSVLLPSDPAGLRQLAASASTGKDAAQLVQHEIERVREQFLPKLPVAYGVIGATAFRLLYLATGYLSAISCTADNVTVRLPAAQPANVPVEFRVGKLTSKQVQYGAVALLLLVLFAALSTSWLAGVAFALTLVLIALEVAPRFIRPNPAKPDMRSKPMQLISECAQQIDGDKVVTILGDMAMVVDQIIEELDKLSMRNTGKTPAKIDPEFIGFLQHLLGDSQREDAQFLRDRIELVPGLLKRQGLRIVTYADLEDQEQVDEYFRVIVNPAMPAITTLLPAIVDEQGVVVEGRVVFPA